MHAASHLTLLAAFWNPQLVRWGVWVGLVVLTVALLLLLRTRWGHSQPLRKCVVLSLLAHLLLGIYLSTVNIVTSTVGSPDGNGIQVALIDGPSGDSALEDRGLDPWDLLGGGGTPAGLDAAAPAASTAPPIEIPSGAQPERNLVAVPSSVSKDKLAELPRHDELEAPPLAPVSEPLMARTASKEAATIEVPEATPEKDIVPPPEPFEPGSGTTDAASSGNAASKSPSPESGAAGNAPSSAPLAPIGPAPAGQASESLSAGGGTGENKPLPEIYKLRVGNHPQVAKGFGATQESEVAVNAALRYLAAAQSANGRWEARRLEAGAARAADGQDRQAAGMQADTGITGLVLLSFLAGGHTHLQGSYRSTVQHGLEFLLGAQGADGNLGVSPNVYERMYSHAMATCALSEAYAMSRDDRLQSAVRRAIGFTIAAQDRRGGGWRYHPGDSGDTSLLGWQVMGLKSAQLAGIPIPDATRDGIARFLKSVSDGRSGGLARYQPTRPVSRPMTAEALACRQFLGLADSPASLNEVSDYLLQELPGTATTNHYYWYYATLSLYQTQGRAWEQWNEALQKKLLASQRASGSLAGSWDPDPIWGGCGGRAYSTALSALCLEVYYRFLPLYIGAADRKTELK